MKKKLCWLLLTLIFRVCQLNFLREKTTLLCVNKNMDFNFSRWIGEGIAKRLDFICVSQASGRKLLAWLDMVNRQEMSNPDRCSIWLKRLMKRNKTTGNVCRRNCVNSRKSYQIQKANISQNMSQICLLQLLGDRPRRRAWCGSCWHRCG